jgi:hypothetical protein
MALHVAGLDQRCAGLPHAARRDVVLLGQGAVAAPPACPIGYEIRYLVVGVR